MTVLMETTAPWKIDAFRGEGRSDVSRQFMSRPADQRFTNLDDLRAAVARWTSESRDEPMDSFGIKIGATKTDQGYQLLTRLPNGVEIEPTHWSFGQLCSLAQVPASWAVRANPRIVALALQDGILDRGTDKVHAYLHDNGTTSLRALTSPDYGRVLDLDVIDAVRKIATPGSPWKVPGMIDWATSRYNPNVDVTKETTTLFASDRDVFLFLVDDQHPIEIGTLPSGEPDLVFRGFYTWNSEVGARKFGLACFMLRGVCANRCLWGVEGFKQVEFRHTSSAPERFAEEVLPALKAYSNGAPSKVIAGVQAARLAKVADDDEERVEFLMRFGFSKTVSESMLARHVAEEGHPASSRWDMAQAVTAHARTIEHQDQRVSVERTATKLLDKVKV